MLIAQLSDPHVRPEGMLYQGVVDSNAQFTAAVAHVNGFDPPPDLVLLSGDLVDEAGHAATLLRQLDGAQDAAAVDPVAIDQVGMPGEPSAARLSVDLVERAVLGVEFYVHQLRAAGDP